MTKKHRIGIVLALIWFLVRVLDHNRRTARRVHHRITSSPSDDHSLGNLADTENTAPYNLDPRNSETETLKRLMTSWRFSKAFTARRHRLTLNDI
jgi:hypothetical protein